MLWRPQLTLTQRLPQLLGLSLQLTLSLPGPRVAGSRTPPGSGTGHRGSSCTPNPEDSPGKFPQPFLLDPRLILPTTEPGLERVRTGPEAHPVHPTWVTSSRCLGLFAGHNSGETFFLLPCGPCLGDPLSLEWTVGAGDLAWGALLSCPLELGKEP